MTIDLNDITRLLSRWLANNNLPSEGVKVSIEFPNKESAFRAENVIKREIEPLMAYHVTGGRFDKIETINGIGLSLNYRKLKEPDNGERIGSWCRR